MKIPLTCVVTSFSPHVTQQNQMSTMNRGVVRLSGSATADDPATARKRVTFEQESLERAAFCMHGMQLKPVHADSAKRPCPTPGTPPHSHLYPSLV